MFWHLGSRLGQLGACLIGRFHQDGSLSRALQKKSAVLVVFWVCEVSRTNRQRMCSTVRRRMLVIVSSQLFNQSNEVKTALYLPASHVSKAPSTLRAGGIAMGIKEATEPSLIVPT